MTPEKLTFPHEPLSHGHLRRRPFGKLPSRHVGDADIRRGLLSQRDGRGHAEMQKRFEEPDRVSLDREALSRKFASTRRDVFRFRVEGIFVQNVAQSVGREIGEELGGGRRLGRMGESVPGEGEMGHGRDGAQINRRIG